MGHLNRDHIWISKVLVKPLPGSEQLSKGMAGAYGIVVCLSKDVLGCVTKIDAELSENGVKLDGLEWALRESDMERPLTDEESTLVKNLNNYPVQFREFHWFK